jgi:hypothetical protein
MKYLVLAMATLSVIGCATQRFDVQPAATKAALSLDDSQVFWVGGIGQEQEVNAAKACGSASQVARVETEETAMNALVRVITLSIYAPRQIRVYCSQ